MIKRLFSLFLFGMFCFSLMPISAQGEENLAKGLSYKIETGEPVEKSYGNYSEGGTKYDVDNGQLTDSKTATNSTSSDGWYRAFRGQSRIVTFDLGDVCAISRVEAGFLHTGNGLYAPRYINVFLSDDGNEYGTAIKYQTEYPLHNKTTAKCDFKVELDKVYSARYVKVEFCSDIFTYCDEIKIIGSKTLSGDEAKVTPDKPEEEPGYFESLDGVSDIIKLYNGYYAPDQDRANLTEERMLPYIAYLDTEGKIVDTMFDAVAFVPCHGDYPSGGRLVKTSGKDGAVMSDWELYFEHTFTDGKDLDALDKVVGKVYGELGIKEKFKVYLTLPYPNVLETPFGDINGDGKDEKSVTLEERVNIVKWFADKCINEFKTKNYQNIQLVGFYWYREEVNYSDSAHEDELVKNINAYVKSKNLTTIFDAFYLSIGYDHWEELGFSGAVMQPNQAFRESRSYFKEGMLEEFAISAHKNHIGVEMETDEPSYFRGNEYLEAGHNYEEYLYYGYKTGYMHSLKTYYQGAGPGSIYDFCHADTSKPKGIYLRRLYDLTYQFIHETYKNEAPILEGVKDIEMVAGERSVTEISVIDNDSYAGDVKAEFTVQPKNGVATVSADKRSLIYRPDRTFVGEDTFTVRITDGFNVSEEKVVKVTVVPNEEMSQESEVSSEESVDNGEEKGMSPWLIALIAALGVLAIGVAIFLILKKK